MTLPVLAQQLLPHAMTGLSAFLGYRGQQNTNRQNFQEAARNRSFQERMRNTQWQAGIADMEAAGINPALAYSQGGAASPGGSTGSAQGDPTSSAMGIIQARKAIKQIEAQTEKTREEARTSSAIADREEARNAAYRIRRRPGGSIELDASMPGLLQLVEAEIGAASAGASSARSIADRNRSLAAGSGIIGDGADKVRRILQGLYRDAGPAQRKINWEIGSLRRRISRRYRYQPQEKEFRR